MIETMKKLIKYAKSYLGRKRDKARRLKLILHLKSKKRCINCLYYSGYNNQCDLYKFKISKYNDANHKKCKTHRYCISMLLKMVRDILEKRMKRYVKFR